MDLITAPITNAQGSDIRVRFCPSPTGTPHVGLIRTALFNWAYARKTGGTFIFRIEDTDANRDSEESYGQLVEALRWLGLDWDEGIDVGGPHEPYRQSQRTEIYLEVVEKLKATGHLYESYLNADEIKDRNLAIGRDPQMGYDNSERELSDEVKAEYQAQGRQPALRLRVPDQDISFTDLVRGEITFPKGSFPDFVLVRPGGEPLYTLVNPVDDALMGVTDVLRGEDLLSSTPRQIVLYNALHDIGVAKFIPRFGHLPFVMGEGNKKLSKRNPESNLFLHRDRGFIPEGLLNYLALLGWSIAADRDIFTLAEMQQSFDVASVNPNPARFDQKKADAINSAHIRLLEPTDFAQRLLPYLQSEGIIGASPTPREQAIISAAGPLLQERMIVLSEAVGMLGFLISEDAELEIEKEALDGLPENAGDVVRAAHAVLAGLEDFTASNIQDRLNSELVERLELKPRVAFGPVRVAVSGRRVTPPLFESMEILGKELSLARLESFAQAH
jgi:glutamyl-tRNA synthetase